MRTRRLRRRRLERGLELQEQERMRLGDVLVAHGLCRERDVWRTLARQWGVPLHRRLDDHWVDREVAGRLQPAVAIAHRVLPLRVRGGVVVVAMADPGDVAAQRLLRETYGRHVLAVVASPQVIRRRQEAVYAQRLVEESTVGLRQRAPDASAAVTLTREQRFALWAVGGVSLLGLIVLGGRFLILVAALVILLYAAVVGFRFYVTFRGGRVVAAQEVTPEQLVTLTDLPVYTLLCPLYREAGVLPQLVEACTRLDYPKSRLDVKLLLEADDVDTIEAVRRFPLPRYFDVLVVPAEGQRTKPKACNYGLQFARGEYTVIYDAEDIPDPDQLKKAVYLFRRSPLDVACVQAKLNYYNPRQNVLTSWFTLEYTAWFDFFLPGLVERHYPVPLGGSSNHFPTALLRQVGGWDPDNVTEDADLGMRLHRSGRRAVMVDSTTWEEANSDFVNWMRQRSRWGKGYLISWLVQMRHPAQLMHDMGWRAFIAVQLTLGGTYAISLLNLLVWTLTALWVLARFGFIAYLFPSPIYYVGLVEMIFGNFLFVYLGLWAAAHRRAFELNRVALVVPLYWVMISLAMVKATMQLITRPTFWEKTVHGLYETAPEMELRGRPIPPVAAPS